MGSLPLAVVLDRTLIVRFPRPEVIEAALSPNMIDWRPWNSTLLVGNPKIWTAFDTSTMSEVEYDSHQRHDVIHVSIGGIGVWGNRHYHRWSTFLYSMGIKRGIDLSTLTYAMVFDYMFRTTPALNVKINDIVSRLSPNGEAYLAMHVRTGADEMSEMLQNKWLHFVDTESALHTMPAAAILAVNQHGLPAGTKWLLATDNIAFANKMLDRWPQNIVLSNTKLSLKHGLHINRGGNAEGALLTFADWLILTRAAILLQAGTSSFSASAIWYRDDQCTQVQGLLRSANTTSGLPLTLCPSTVH
jgi:hypothetical protein